MSRFLKASWLILIFIPCLIWGQAANFRRLGLEEGLPTLAINAAVEGPQGFIWMASEGSGLLRFDGYRFESYFVEDYPLIEELVRSWRGERLYFHNGRKLAEYDGLELLEIKLPEGSTIINIADVGGRLFVATTKGLYHWDGDSLMLKGHLPKGTKRISYGQEQLRILSDSALFLWEDDRYSLVDSGNFVLPAGGAEFYFKGDSLISEKERCSQVLSDLGPVYQAYGQNENWFVLGAKALRCRQIIEGQEWVYELPLGAYFSPSTVRALAFVQGQLMVLSSQGIFISEGPWQHYQARQMPIMALAVQNRHLYTASPMGLDLGEYGAGLSSRGLILDVLADEMGLWVATESGLFFQDPKRVNRSEATKVEGFVFSLGKDATKLWAAASSGIWQGLSGHWELALDAEEIDFASIFSIKHQEKVGTWFASYTQGLWQFKDDKWQHQLNIGGLALDSIGVSALEVLPDGRLAIGTLNGGLYLVDISNKAYQHYNPKALEYAEIRDLLWADGHLWLGTNKGLVSLVDVAESAKAGESARIHFFGYPVNSNCLQMEDGTLYAAGDQGLFTWDLKGFVNALPQAKIGLLDAAFLREGAKQEEEDFARKAFSGLPIRENLDHDANYLRFRFGLRNLYHPEWVQYRYRLLGQSNEWTYSGTSREALFSDLKAGNYTLEVEARYPWESWTMSAEPYVFQIKEAFWRTWWFWTLLVLSLIILAYGFIKDRWQRREERLRLENELLEMERKALRLQMNPHFIFNALDSISSFIFKQDPKMAVRYLNNFAKLMRLTLESSMEHIHPVETEVSVLKNYLELEKLRFEGKFDYEIEMDEELDFDIGLPPMLIQPHVENAILHGLKPKDGKGFLSISFKLEGPTLCCTIEDDGIGREAAKDLPNKKAHRSMATQINKDRIDLLKRSMNEVIDLKIIDKYNQQGQAAGTKVVIRLPAQEL